MKYQTNLNRKRQQFTCVGESLTKQEFKDDCNPTLILEKFQRTGLIDHVNQYQPVFGEQSSLTYYEAISITRNAQNQFNDLPSSTRHFFNQDIGEYLDFISDPDNVEKLERGISPHDISTEKNEEETPSETTKTEDKVSPENEE